MLIRKKVRSLLPHLSPFAKQGDIYVVLPHADAHDEALVKMGFSIPLMEGEHALPPAAAGIAARRNADGEEIVHRDQPLEVHYRQKEWTWQEFHGRYDKVERTKVVEVPYKRYPRTQMAPYAIELTVRTTQKGEAVVVAGPFSSATAADDKVLLNTVHMFIELFGECTLTKDDLALTAQPTRRQLNWEILPPGKYPWVKARPAVAKVISESSPANQSVINARFKEITAYEPDFMAVGLNGFSRYVVYGWDKHKLYILESTEVDNATYVLKDDWQRVSAMSKAEVLNASAHHARLIHRKAWFRQLAELMRGQQVSKP
ncbi:hypothetical protein [Noviherbaspirillum sp. UKPF54]|uniref:hypothetical protein n=1 Tax=Noviherbaspirillum sp. UKPF54 TaxID=2601898 RepID=UPI0011B16544|nr:hypothetical protein [Noviherbaspirillum sp. UKPF54]QDZ28701.1 hypothetical protein FAY22_12515 [Noviherbaspirillum sp. UKPF54]